MTAEFTLSAFGDEIADDVDEQLSVLNELDIRFLELRRAWGTNVLELSDDEVSRLRDRCEAHSISVSCIGSPVGKSPIGQPIDEVLRDLERILDVAQMLGTDKVRIFSFYPETDGRQDAFVDESITRLGAMAKSAGERNAVLLLENEGGLVGDTPERCKAIVEGVGSPSLRFVWDTGNFPHSGVERAVDRGWPLLAAYTDYVQGQGRPGLGPDDHRRRRRGRPNPGAPRQSPRGWVQGIPGPGASSEGCGQARRLQRRRGNEAGGRRTPRTDRRGGRRGDERLAAAADDPS